MEEKGVDGVKKDWRKRFKTAFARNFFALLDLFAQEDDFIHGRKKGKESKKGQEGGK